MCAHTTTRAGQSARYDPGGGGINVARIAHLLGAPAPAVLPAAGPTGGLLVTLLGEAGVPCQRIPIAAAARESFTANEQNTKQPYRFALPGPDVAGVTA